MIDLALFPEIRKLMDEDTIDNVYYNQIKKSISNYLDMDIDRYIFEKKKDLDETNNFDFVSELMNELYSFFEMNINDIFGEKINLNNNYINLEFDTKWEEKLKDKKWLNEQKAKIIVDKLFSDFPKYLDQEYECVEIDDSCLYYQKIKKIVRSKLKVSIGSVYTKPEELHDNSVTYKVEKESLYLFAFNNIHKKNLIGYLQLSYGEKINWKQLLEDYQEQIDIIDNKYNYYNSFSLNQECWVENFVLKNIIFDYLISSSYYTLEIQKFNREDMFIKFNGGIFDKDIRTILNNNKDIIDNPIATFGVFRNSEKNGYKTNYKKKFTNNNNNLILSSYLKEFSITFFDQYKINPYLKRINNYYQFSFVVSNALKNESYSSDISKRMIFELYTGYDVVNSVVDYEKKFKDYLCDQINNNNTNIFVNKFKPGQSDILKAFYLDTLINYVKIPCPFGRSYFIDRSVLALRNMIHSNENMTSSNIIYLWKEKNDKIISKMANEIIPLIGYCFFICFFELSKYSYKKICNNVFDTLNIYHFNSFISHMKKSLEPYCDINFADYYKKFMKGNLDDPSNKEIKKVINYNDRKLNKIEKSIIQQIIELMYSMPIKEPLYNIMSKIT